MNEDLVGDPIDSVVADYKQDWVDLLCENTVASTRKGTSGSLDISPFRSIYWKKYLKCLPKDHSLWVDEANAAREKYETVINKFEINPRSSIADSDLHTNHPLSSSTESLWYKHFQNKSLKISIKQDVIRTFPEVQFFRSEKIQKMMINILFYYAQQHPDICYRQGMHELLAPIIYVLQNDQNFYLELSKYQNLPVEIGILLNPNYIEHDAFQLFCHLMDAVEVWYISTEVITKRSHKYSREPFSRQVDSTQKNGLGMKLIKIYENHLKRHNVALYDHLTALDIAPQIYGIRWLRLLFGREFPFNDVLILWDAIFANTLSFDFVEYIFTSMLINIEEELCASDYNSCLSMLMHYPKVNKIQDIRDCALKLSDQRSFEDKKHSQNTINSKNSPEENSSVFSNFKKMFPKRLSNGDLKNNNSVQITKAMENMNLNQPISNLNEFSSSIYGKTGNSFSKSAKNNLEKFEEMVPVKELSNKNLQMDIHNVLRRIKAVNDECYDQTNACLHTLETLCSDKLYEKLRISEVPIHLKTIHNLLITSFNVINQDLNLDHGLDAVEELKNSTEYPVIEKTFQQI